METESCSDRRWFAVVLHLNRLPRNWTEPRLAWKRVGQKGSEMLKILDGRNGGEKNQTLNCVFGNPPIVDNSKSFLRDDLETQMPSGRGSTSTALRTNKDYFKLLILELTSFELHVDFQPSP